MTRPKVRPIAVRTADDLVSLDPVAQERREQAFAALSDMRRNGWSLTRAARANDISPADTRRYTGSAIQRGASGRYLARPFDRQFRLMQALTTEGRITVAVRDSRTAALLAQHGNTVRAYLDGKGDGRLRALPRKTFTANGVAYTLETDIRKIDEHARRGEVAYEDLYVH